MEIPVLMYHHVRPDVSGDDVETAVTPETLENQLAWLARKQYRSVSLDEAAHHVSREKVCVITFDDGYLDVWDQAVPILGAYGMTATVFAISAHLGGVNQWSSGDEQLMTKEQLAALRKKGWTIGSHTCTHPHLPKLDAGAQRQELMDSKIALQELLGEPVTVFAYPYNEWDAVTHDLVKKAGYQYACAISSPGKSVFADPFAIRRVFVKRSDAVGDFKRKVGNWYLKYRGWKKH